MIKLQTLSRVTAGRKPYIGRVTGLGGKFGIEIDFCSNPTVVTEPGIYKIGEVDNKGRPEPYFVVIAERDGGGLVEARVREETVVEVLSSGRPVADLLAYEWKPGKYAVRRDGKLLWRDSRDALLSEREKLLARIAEIDAALATEEAGA